MFEIEIEIQIEIEKRERKREKVVLKSKKRDDLEGKRTRKKGRNEACANTLPGGTGPIGSYLRSCVGD